MKMYSYVDFVTGKKKKTRGKFKGWTKRMGVMNCRYAEFENPCSVLAVPEYCMLKETLARIGSPPKDEEV
jgi:hypothetical protein